MSAMAASRRPRRRSDEARREVLRAAWSLLEDGGAAAVTVEALAAATGVAKTTIYRSWSNAAAIAVDAFLDEADRSLPSPDSGDVRADLRAQLSAVAAFLASPRGQLLAQMLGEAQRDATLAETLRTRFVEPRREATRAILARAQARGDLADGIDFELIIDLLVGPMYWRLLVGHQPITEGLAAAVVESIAPLHRGLGERSARR